MKKKTNFKDRLFLSDRLILLALFFEKEADSRDSGLAQCTTRFLQEVQSLYSDRYTSKLFELNYIKDPVLKSNNLTEKGLTTAKKLSYLSFSPSKSDNYDILHMLGSLLTEIGQNRPHLQDKSEQICTNLGPFKIDNRKKWSPSDKK